MPTLFRLDSNKQLVSTNRGPMIGRPIEGSETLAAFVKERGTATWHEYVTRDSDNGVVYDLHPDIRWCPPDVVPGD